MADYAHNYTDKQLEVLEKRFQAVYRQAEKEVTEKLEEYLKKFEAKDKAKQKLLAEGKISEEDYKNWRYGQMMTGKRWKEMRDKLAQDYTNANQNAVDAMNHRLPDVFAENTNYSTYEIENGLHVDTSFTMYDRQTVDRLLRDNPELLPQPSVDIPKDLRWNRQKIQGAIEQGILQGESIPKIAKRLQKVTDMNKSAATRNARTAMTGAQNGGRIESYHRAQSLGINLKKCWLATMDNRVRHEHAALDGQTVEVDKPFKIAGDEIMFPGDSSAPGYLVWNCRCTLIAQLKGFEHDVSQGRFSKLDDMSYDEWKSMHEKAMAQTKDEVDVDVPGKVFAKVGGGTYNKSLDGDCELRAFFGAKEGSKQVGKYTLPKNDDEDKCVAFGLPEQSGFIDGKFASDDTKNTISTNGRVALNSAYNRDRGNGRLAIQNMIEDEIDRLAGIRQEGIYYRVTSNPKEKGYLQKGTIKASVNHLTGEKESGLSVWERPKYADQYMYKIKGELIDIGSDGEPILDTKTIEFLGEAGDIEKMREEGRKKFMKKYNWTESQLKSALEGRINFK